MIYKPHEYQQYAIDYIETHPISAVLLDMGLGKTSITLTALQDLLFERFEAHKVLIIAPLRVAKNTWPAELQKWEHLHDITLSVVVGNAEERQAALAKKADLYVINREMVLWLVEQSGYKFDFDTVVIDELSSFKNHQSKRFKALMKVRPKIKRMIALTGTPSSNGLMDLWAEFRLLDMGERLGRYITQYRNQYFMPDKRNAQVVFSYKPMPGAEEKIYEKISDITISMKATDFLPMPDRIENEYPVYLSEEEREKYDALKQEMVLKLTDKEITVANAASLSGKLSQLANGAIYTDEKEVIPVHDRKLDALEDIIEAAAGKPILVAYWFQHDLQRITERLEALKVSYARISSPGCIDMWNRGEFTVGLIHPASAGHGLNLQEGGSTLVWFGLTWSLELYQQTNARLYRQGQKNTVIIHHIISKGTIDEDVLKALERKDTTQTALIDAVKAQL